MSDKGKTVVDNTVRDKPASGANAYPQTGHQSQWYDDNYRYSTDEGGKSGGHWTDQGKSDKSPDRHTPPNDARKK